MLQPLPNPRPLYDTQKKSHNGDTRGGKLCMWFSCAPRYLAGERLPCQAEDSNDTDPFEVAIKKGADIIGHVPRKISRACLLEVVQSLLIPIIVIVRFASGRFANTLQT